MGGLGFDRPIAPGGYAWWYVDALSDDGRHGVALIALIGSVFSPYYFRARRRGLGDPYDHVALNVALYGPRGNRWALTERGRRALDRSRDALAIGSSALDWNGSTLTIRIDELTVPLPSRIRGCVRVHANALTGASVALDAAGRHRWTPHAPVARVEVSLERPALAWSGTGYIDGNHGDRPLEDDFVRWDWSRASGGDAAVVLYDVARRDGGHRALACRFDSSGRMTEVTPPRTVALAPSRWRLARRTRTDDGAAPEIVRSLEDGPFYARSALHTRLHGATMPAIHESLDLDRFRARWVQALLPFKNPRVPG